jgi:hypothetical protein
MMDAKYFLIYSKVISLVSAFAPHSLPRCCLKTVTALFPRVKEKEKNCLFTLYRF